MKTLRRKIEKFLGDRLRLAADRLSPRQPYEIVFEPTLMVPPSIEFVEVQINGRGVRAGRWVRSGKYRVLSLPR